ncbi:hypothetical protein BFW01_g5151 [Lasiodiplodia theobromae]|nr:hypothetical protein BFW01_g5151 [Lasiodiplodia theobromae]
MKVEIKEEVPSIGSPAHPPEPGSVRDIAVKLEDAVPPMSNSQAARAPSDPIIPPVNPLTSALDNPIIAGGGPVTSPAPTTSLLTRPSSHAWKQHIPTPAWSSTPEPAVVLFIYHFEGTAQDVKKFLETPDQGFEVSSSEFRSVLTSAKQDPIWKVLAECLEKNYAGPSVSGTTFRMEKKEHVEIWIVLYAKFKILAPILSQCFPDNEEQETPDEPVEDGDHWESQAAGPANPDGENEYRPVKEGDHRELQRFLTWKRRQNNTAVTFHDWCLIRNQLMQFDEKLEEEDKKKKMVDAP